MPENEIPPAMRVDIYLASFECLAALSANAVNMPLKISVIDELCQHILLKHGNRTGIKPHLPEMRQRAFWAEPYTRFASRAQSSY